jgi:hypothetical protein
MYMSTCYVASTHTEGKLPVQILFCVLCLVQWGTGVITNAKGGADKQLGEKQWMWCYLRPERATTSFQMRHSQGMTFPIALSTSSPSCVSVPRIGLVPSVPHYICLLRLAWQRFYPILTSQFCWFVKYSQWWLYNFILLQFSLKCYGVGLFDAENFVLIGWPSFAIFKTVSFRSFRPM